MKHAIISSKPYKAWCKERGIDFYSYIQQFPLVYAKLGYARIPIVDKPKIKLTLWGKIKNFFKY